jgi:putative ATP-dependent endonuclease of the OLD family
MYISKLVIDGFRSINSIEINFEPGKNVIVGKNNSGKSNIVRALDLVIGEKYPTYADIEESDFHQTVTGEKSTDITIITEIKGDDCDYSRIKSLKGVYKGVCKKGEDPIDFIDGKLEYSLSNIFIDPEDLDYDNGNANHGTKAYFKGNGINNLVKSLKSSNTWYFIFTVKRDPSSPGEYVREFRFFYKEEDTGKWMLCWGIPKDFRDAFLTSAILPAFREPHYQLRINNWSWYGKLIRTIVEKKQTINPDIQRDLDLAFNQIKLVGEPVFIEISEEINKKVRVGFTNTKVRLQFTATEQTEMHKQVQIYVNDGIDSLISSKGSGIQSAIVIGLFAYYCSTQHKNTSVLVVEEPEIYLHPQARRVISQRLDEFVSFYDTKRNQVIVTTHTTEFVQSGDPATITVVKKESGETNVKTISFNPNTLAEKEIKEYQKVMRQEGAEMFFADKVILCEGAEVYLLPKIADLLHSTLGVLDENNISVIRVDGKGNFYAYTQVLDKIGVPWFILADLDFFSQGLGDFKNLIGETKYQQMKAEASAIRDQYSKENSWVEEPKIKKHLTKTKETKDAEAFAREMENWEHSPTHQPTIEKVLSLWQHIKPSIKKRLSLDVIESDEIFKERFLRYLRELFLHNIWILKKGELEDYIRLDTKEASDLLKNGKISDAKLLQVCYQTDTNIQNYFRIEEFKDFIEGVLPLKTPFLESEIPSLENIEDYEEELPF